MPRYRFHILPEDGLDDLEFRFADDFSALQTAQVIIRDHCLRQQRGGNPNITKVIEVVRADSESIGFVAEAAASLAEDGLSDKGEVGKTAASRLRAN